jgi:hypothetical protein
LCHSTFLRSILILKPGTTGFSPSALTRRHVLLYEAKMPAFGDKRTALTGRERRRAAFSAALDSFFENRPEREPNEAACGRFLSAMTSMMTSIGAAHAVRRG